ncbi:hypothetical protein [Streptomyces sp. LS1784]|uniref:hypothetical protein n=1 Tax=Streptomyces sp. LS1784 TaxID=2851533 RepID=UPI001CCCBADD|nr:hypothetical protein [Streptomyces sp. LS1784]
MVAVAERDRRGYLIQAQLADTGKYRYERAIKLLRRLRATHTTAGVPDGFTRYLVKLRAEAPADRPSPVSPSGKIALGAAH